MARGDAAAILARRSPGLIRFFEWQFRRNLRASFNAVRLAMPEGLPAASGPLVMYSNHAAWWDAVIWFTLGRRLFPDRKGYGPMDGAQLGRYPFLGRLGLFGVDANSYSGAARFLSLSAAILARPDTLMWIAAEGDFTDCRVRPVRLRPGLARLAGTGHRFHYLPVAIEYVFWGEKRPELLVRLGQPIASASLPADREAAQATLESALGRTMDALAGDAMARNAEAFETLLVGCAGIGGIYDVLRRILSLAGGQHFRARHLP